MTFPTAAEWFAPRYGIGRRNDDCRNMLNMTAAGARMTADREKFFIEVVFADPAIIEVWNYIDPRTGRPNNITEVVLKGGKRERWSWKKCCDPDKDWTAHNEIRALRTTIEKDIRPRGAHDCADCGRPACAWHHESPTFEEMYELMSKPISIRDSEMRGRECTDESKNELIRLHKNAVMLWLCAPCHNLRTAELRRGKTA